jgi:streptogramin lyase
MRVPTFPWRLTFVVALIFIGMFSQVQQGRAEPFLFAANPNDVTVTMIDVATGQSTIIMDARDGLTRPSELTIDKFGNLYVANVSSPDILRLSINGQVTVFVSGEGILSEVQGLVFSPQGDLFIASQDPNRIVIYRFDATSRSLKFFGDVTSANQAFNILESIVFDRQGNLYVASGQNVQGLGAIVKFDSQGNSSVFAAGLENPRDLAVDLGHLYVANRVGEVINRLDLSTGSIEVFADLSQALGDPRGIKTDLQSNVYVLNSNGDIRKWNSDGIGGTVEFQSGSSFSEALAFFSRSMLNIALDVKPGEFPNLINISRDPNRIEVIPVAILTTSNFDATEVDPTTVRFGKTGTEAGPVQVAFQDADGDGTLDLVLHFRTQDTGLQCGDTSASLTGKTVSGQAIMGSDAIVTTRGGAICH